MNASDSSGRNSHCSINRPTLAECSGLNKFQSVIQQEIDRIDEQIMSARAGEQKLSSQKDRVMNRRANEEQHQQEVDENVASSRHSTTDVELAVRRYIEKCQQKERPEKAVHTGETVTVQQPGVRALENIGERSHIDL